MEFLRNSFSEKLTLRSSIDGDVGEIISETKGLEAERKTGGGVAHYN